MLPRHYFLSELETALEPVVAAVTVGALLVCVGLLVVFGTVLLAVAAVRCLHWWAARLREASRKGEPAAQLPGGTLSRALHFVAGHTDARTGEAVRR